MKKICSLILGVMLPCFSQWVMFEDSKDTYIYNTQSGEIYVLYRKKGKNYENVFVKMPRGMRPNELKQPSKTIQSKQDEDLKNQQVESLKKSQEMMNEALKGSF